MKEITTRKKEDKQSSSSEGREMKKFSSNLSVSSPCLSISDGNGKMEDGIERCEFVIHQMYYALIAFSWRQCELSQIKRLAFTRGTDRHRYHRVVNLFIINSSYFIYRWPTLILRPTYNCII